MKTFKICDTHNDFLTELDEADVLEYIKKCQKKNVEVVCSSFWSTNFSKHECEKKLKICKAVLNKSDSEFLLHVEDLHWVEDKNALEYLINIKPFSCSLTWNNANALAGGAKSTAGLTKWGEKCVEELSKVGIVVDVAHLNRKSFNQTTKLLKKNIFCSHTGFYGLKHHERNLTDKQIEQIVRSDGFIGLFFYDKCVQMSNKKNFSSDDIIKNIKYFTTKWGFDNLGFGTDFYGIENYPKDLQNYSDFKNLIVRLQEEGFTEEQIEKLFYKNFKQFMLRCCIK